MLKDIILAIRAYREAHRFVIKQKLWKWIIVPGIVYMCMFCISMYFFIISASNIIEIISVKTGLRDWVNSMRSTVAGFLFTIGGIMFWLILLQFYFSLFKFLWLIVGSPIFAYLSEKTEALLEGTPMEFSWMQLLKDALRGVGIALRNTLWQSVYLLSLLVISIIPLVGWVVPVFALLVECYYYGFSMLDYSCERHQLTAQESILFIGNRKGLAIANGLLFYLMHLVPVVGWVLAPAYSVIAATLSIYRPQQNAGFKVIPATV